MIEKKHPLSMSPEEEWQRAWKYHKTADELLGVRLNYGMVAQSMLLVSFITSICHEQRFPFTVIECAISGFGIFYSVIQHRMSRAMIDRLDYLKEHYLRRLDPIYVDYLDMPYKTGRPRSYKGNQRRTAPVLVVIWAIMFLIAWVFWRWL